LAVSAALSSLVFGWGALVLPWRPGTPLALLGGGLGLLHASTALAAVWSPRHVLWLWRLLAICCLGAASIFVAALGFTGFEMVRMYGALGWGLAVLLGVIGWLLVVCTVPMGIWGLRRTAGVSILTLPSATG
jgi:hypothetical protein